MKKTTTLPPCCDAQSFTELATEADVIDVVSLESDRPLRHFVADCVGHRPPWLRFLYRVRAVFAAMLRLDTQEVPLESLSPEDVPMQPGGLFGFFGVTDAREDAYWMAGIDDAHLSASLGIVRDPAGPAGQATYHVITFVRYHDWRGPVYYNTIRPFHHLVVARMARAGARGR